MNAARSYVEHFSDAELKTLKLGDEGLEKLVLGKNPARPPAPEPTTVHCEIQLLEYFLVKEGGKNLTNTYDYIGCSKEPCWLCDIVIRTATAFKTAPSHGGIYWNWTLSKTLASLPDVKCALTAADDRMMEIIQQARE